MTAVMHAARNNLTKALPLLQNLGDADLEARDHQGWTPLMHAADSQAMEAAHWLAVDAQPPASLLPRNNDDWTVTMLVSAQGSSEMLELLVTVAGGVPTQSVEETGLTCLMLAAQHGNLPCVQYLAEQCQGNDLLQEVQPGQRDVYCVDIKRKDVRGWAAWRVAVMNRRFEVFEYLFALGNEDVSDRDGNGLSVLMVAAQLGEVCYV